MIAQSDPTPSSSSLPLFICICFFRFSFRVVCLFFLFSFIVFVALWVCLARHLLVVCCFRGIGPNKQLPAPSSDVCQCVVSCVFCYSWHFSRFANHPQKHALNSDIASLPAASLPATSCLLPTDCARSPTLSMWVRRRLDWLWRVHCAKLLCTLVH